METSLTIFLGVQVVRGANGNLRMVRNSEAEDGFRGRKLTGFRDESFNSITGLNGSGKSNILDAICFVLGITNMSTVRAQNLQVRRNRTARMERKRMLIDDRI